MKRAFLFLSPAFLLVYFTGSVNATQPLNQPNASPVNQERQRQRGATDDVQLRTLIVRLPVSVKEKNKFVAGLSSSHFEVYEDGRRQQIDRFEAPSKLPLNIAVLMDTSNSVKLKLPFEKDAAEDFVATVMRVGKRDRVLFATFDSNVELHQDFTDEHEALISSIRKAKAGGYTRLYDAVFRVIEEKMATLRGDDARRIMVVLSDGTDTASERTLKEAIELAQRYDVTVFGISTKNFSGVTAGVVETKDDKELRQLCEQTGGQLFLPSEKVELFRAFSAVEHDLRQEYVIHYTPSDQSRTGRQRKIDIKLSRGAKGKTHYKKAYDDRPGPVL